MNDWIQPISADRSVPAVDFRRLTPIEREEERHQRERRRRNKAEQDEKDGPEDGQFRIDVRV